jgi:hypothetical protein
MDAYLATPGILGWRKVRRLEVARISPVAVGPGLQAGMSERSKGFAIPFASR